MTVGRARQEVFLRCEILTAGHRLPARCNGEQPQRAVAEAGAPPNMTPFVCGTLPNQRTACKMACTTCSTLMPFMQRKSIGHSRKKHGEHAASDFNSRCCGSPGSPGPVNSGDVLPKGTTTSVPSAAATCIGPVSFVSRSEEHTSELQSRQYLVCRLF